MMRIESMADNVRTHLEELIFQGELRPGQQIKEQFIASSLGISRPPIREALKLLESEGLITRKPNRGAFVTRITERDAWEIYTMKSDLYNLATRLAFDSITDEHIREWEDVVDEMETCVHADPPDLMGYQALNQRFHDIMIDISGHGRLKNTVIRLHNQVRRFSCLSLTGKGHLEESYSYHKAILKALTERDLDKTMRLTAEHIDRGLTIVQNRIASETEPNTSPSTVPISAADEGVAGDGSMQAHVRDAAR